MTSTTFAIKNDMKATNSKYVNLYWIIGVMSISIVCLVVVVLTKECIDTDVLMTYMSFASTLLSIVLSIFAIMYSYYSTVEMSRQESNINNAVGKIEESIKNINGNNNTLLQTVISIKGDTEAIKIYSASNKVDDIVESSGNTTNLPPQS